MKRQRRRLGLRAQNSATLLVCVFATSLITITGLIEVSDDSHLNCKHAQARGWTTVHLVEPGLPVPEVPASKYQIRDLEELRDLFPQFFKSNGREVTA